MSKRAFVAMALVATFGLVAGCGGGSPSSDHVGEPLVRNFSPFMSPFDFDNLQQNPTFTNSTVTVSADPNYPGKFVIFFQSDTVLDPTSVFIGGNSFLGPDPSVLQVTREVPGVGNVQVPVQVTVEPDRIICQPLPPFSAPNGSGGYTTNLPDGQYTLGVFKNLKNSVGAAMRDAPVFHSFTVGESDTIRPRVITTNPVNGQEQVGAGVPPPAPPPGVPENNIANVTTSIFGDTTPDITVRFTEGINANTVTASTITVVDAGAFQMGGGAPPPLAPAPQFPRLKSLEDRSTLPSNGHEALWRADPLLGGFPFGTQVQVTVLGEWMDQASQAANPTTPDAQAPITDLAGQKMEFNFTFQFQTIAPPNLPANPHPEYAIWWSASDRVGVVDALNMPAQADQVTGVRTFPNGIPLNTLPQFTDEIATDQNIPNFDPLEINVDARTNGGTCHTWIYVQSFNSGQVAILNSRNGVPVALINSPGPGGITSRVGDGTIESLLVTNSGANTFTAFNIGSLTPGTPFLNGPLFITKVQPTGNTPRAITVGGIAAVAPEIIMYADFTDGTVNTITLSDAAPVRQFALGPSSSPNDVCFTPCFGPPVIPYIMYAAISQGGLPGNGKVAYYVAGPNCQTGTQNPGRPDTIVGDLGSLDGPDGLDASFTGNVFFTVAESGSSANAISTLGVETGTGNLPVVINQFTNVGANPTKVAHRPGYVGNNLVIPPPGVTAPTCFYSSAFVGWDPFPNGAVERDLYVCARGASQITVLDLNSGVRNFYSPVKIAGVRFVATVRTQ